MTSDNIHAASFRDPSGFIFTKSGALYRQINLAYRDHYDHLVSSGLLERLTSESLLIPHEEADMALAQTGDAYKVIKPKRIPFISYPYEWSFSQLKDSALLTLNVQKQSFEAGMSLKDCSAYNIQFIDGRPALIDTLSFEKYVEGSPWVAYRQFCQHFLAPLALMSKKDIRLGQLSRIFIDGVPLDMASSLLGFGSYFSFPLLTHIHLHAKSQKRFNDKTVDISARKMSRNSLLGLIDNLERAIEKLTWTADSEVWADYYDHTNYSTESFEDKKEIVTEYLARINPSNVWDLGGNVGLFSRIPAKQKINTISFDVDSAAVERNYLECKKEGGGNLLPLILDLSNPSPDMGWALKERESVIARGPADMAFALALIHHLAIANNVPLNKIADFFPRICSSLIIEFVPKEDSQVRRLLSTREDIFPGYDRPSFENEFKKYFTIEKSRDIRGSSRTLYLMRKK